MCVFFSKVEIANTEGVFVIAVKDNQSTTKIFGKCKYSTRSKKYREKQSSEAVVMVKPWFSTIENSIAAAAVLR